MNIYNLVSTLFFSFFLQAVTLQLKALGVDNVLCLQI